MSALGCWAVLILISAPLLSSATVREGDDVVLVTSCSGACRAVRPSSRGKKSLFRHRSPRRQQVLPAIDQFHWLGALLGAEHANQNLRSVPKCQRTKEREGETNPMRTRTRTNPTDLGFSAEQRRNVSNWKNVELRWRAMRRNAMRATKQWFFVFCRFLIDLCCCLSLSALRHHISDVPWNEFPAHARIISQFAWSVRSPLATLWPRPLTCTRTTRNTRSLAGSRS